MRRVLAIIAALLVLGAIPANATHIQEPTNPITGLSLLLGTYPGGLTDCASLGDFTPNTIAIQGYVTATAVPSEHFTVSETVSKVTGQAATYDWRAQWPHQNIPPHANRTWQVFVSDTNDLDEHIGLWRVDVRVVGDVSKALLTATCTFNKV